MLGRACLTVRGDCQKTISRPLPLVKTSWERCPLARSVGDDRDGRPTPGARTQRSTLDDLTALGHASGGIGYQKSAFVLGHVPAVRNTRPPAIGRRRRHRSDDSSSGFAMITSWPAPGMAQG